MWSEDHTVRLVEILRQKVLEIELHSYKVQKTHATDHESWHNFLEQTKIERTDWPRESDEQNLVIPDPWWTALGYKAWIVIPIEIAQKILVLGSI